MNKLQLQQLIREEIGEALGDVFRSKATIEKRKKEKEESEASAKKEQDKEEWEEEIKKIKKWIESAENDLYDPISGSERERLYQKIKGWKIDINRLKEWIGNQHL